MSVNTQGGGYEQTCYGQDPRLLFVKAYGALSQKAGNLRQYLKTKQKEAT
jgi:hypothetical protein